MGGSRFLPQCPVFRASQTGLYSSRDIQSPELFRVQLREQHLYYEDQLLPVNRIIVHPNYYSVETGADIALLELKDAVNVSTHVHPISLPPAAETFPSGTSCWVTGWGDINNAGMCQGWLPASWAGTRSHPAPTLEGGQGFPRLASP